MILRDKLHYHPFCVSYVAAVGLLSGPLVANALANAQGFTPSAAFRLAVQKPPWPIDLNTNERHAVELLENAFGGNASSPFAINIDHTSGDKEVEHATGSEMAATYGEILPASVIKMLSLLNATAGQKYYDLGSGFGKTAMLAWLMGLDATGVELAGVRHTAGCAMLTKLPPAPVGNPTIVPGLRLWHTNVLDVDFSDADIVFTDNLLFPAELSEGIAKTARRMKPGSVVVSAQTLPMPGFREVDPLPLPTSWSFDFLFNVQIVLGDVAQGSPSPAKQGIAQQTKLQARTERKASDICEITTL